jgi:hypothetical protein
VSDPFNILGADFDAPPAFDAAVAEALARFRGAAARFAGLSEAVPEDALTEDEWRVVELAAQDLEAAIERAEEGYVAVQYDAHAWYRIMESLDTITRRLDSACGILELARAREAA